MTRNGFTERWVHKQRWRRRGDRKKMDNKASTWAPFNRRKMMENERKKIAHVLYFVRLVEMIQLLERGMIRRLEGGKKVIYLLAFKR